MLLYRCKEAYYLTDMFTGWIYSNRKWATIRGNLELSYLQINKIGCTSTVITCCDWHFCFRNNGFTREWNQYAINKSTDYTWKPQILSKTLGITSVSAVLSSRPTLSATYHLCNIDGPLIHLVKYARVRVFTGPCFPVKIYDSVPIRE